jgi:hypothetical protein
MTSQVKNQKGRRIGHSPLMLELTFVGLTFQGLTFEGLFSMELTWKVLICQVQISARLPSSEPI